ncbi:chemotaxis protein methyltransferase CheR [Filimonas zeae]|uniref:Chemotaxis protein R n=1 Tax=Filimonas zeae TaxID=1737353 RepID=A0A917IXX3_9BACT|nr:protein-glutamate O-methyltransferase CheR [Filimonas zeae]MDR6338583.1 chemotaxis protein methyltransferase CheR [Filimonas zeae]GGH67548.1 chemotaxis protein R [Filimonas zeae]
MSTRYDISPGELAGIVELIKLNYGYDFSDYAHASLLRRVLRFMDTARVKTAYDLKYHLTNDKDFFAWFLQTVTVNVTEMFRDPLFYKTLRDKVLPKLAAYPVIKIWHAGCSTGEEVFSMCILLHEAGLLDRARIYATDLNPVNIEKAKTGIVPMRYMKEYTANYQQSGGKNDFSAYYTARYENALISKELRSKIIFSQHNLVSDHVFNEFQLVCCRNVLIYFNKDLQNRIYHLFYDSLTPMGYLAIGMKESLLFTDIRHRFETVHAAAKIFKRKL